MGRSGSSRKGKKSISDKPKHPQRGLGVAQLERIRLHNQMMSGCLPSIHFSHPNSFNKENVRGDTTFSSSSSSCYTTIATSSLCGLHPRITMGFGDGRPDMTFNDFQYRETARSSQTQSFAQGPVTLPLFQQTTEDFSQRRRQQAQHWRNSTSLGSQNSDSCGTKDLDLELRLSL